MDDDLIQQTAVLRRDLQEVRRKLSVRDQVWPLVLFLALGLVYANWENAREERARVRGLEARLKAGGAEVERVREAAVRLAAPGPVREDLEGRFRELRALLVP